MPACAPPPPPHPPHATCRTRGGRVRLPCTAHLLCRCHCLLFSAGMGRRLCRPARTTRTAHAHCTFSQAGGRRAPARHTPTLLAARRYKAFAYHTHAITLATWPLPRGDFAARMLRFSTPRTFAAHRNKFTRHRLLLSQFNHQFAGLQRAVAPRCLIHLMYAERCVYAAKVRSSSDNASGDLFCWNKHGPLLPVGCASRRT